MSFWNLVLEPGKKYEKVVENGIHVSQATLDTTKALGTDDIVQVVLEYDGRDMTVANLSMKKGIFQAPLDLSFSTGDNIAFTSSGAAIPVTLTGLAGDGSDEDSSEDEEDFDTAGISDEELEVVPAGTKRKINDNDSSIVKALKAANALRRTATMNGESFMSESESDDDNYNPTQDPDLTRDSDELLGQEIDEEYDTDEFSNDECLEQEEEMVDSEITDSDELEEEEEEEEMIMPEPLAKKAKLMNGHSTPEVSTPKQTKKDKLKAAATKEDKSPAKSGKTPSKEGKSAMTPAKEGKAHKSGLTPAKEGKKDKSGMTPAKEGKKDKSGMTPAKEGKKDKSSTTPSKKEKAAKEGKSPAKQTIEGSPNGNKENIDAKTPKKDKKKKNKNKDGTKVDTPVSQVKAVPAAPKSPSPKEPVLRTGGVLIEDLTVGQGIEAKIGSNVSMYYVGRFKNSQKCFDKNLSGPPFKFRLGRGEVIKGWDVGVLGMKVGGKRKIMVPSQMGYGKSGAPPQIPANAALEFEVTLLSF